MGFNKGRQFSGNNNGSKTNNSRIYSLFSNKKAIMGIWASKSWTNSCLIFRKRKKASSTSLALTNRTRVLSTWQRFSTSKTWGRGSSVRSSWSGNRHCKGFMHWNTFLKVLSKSKGYKTTLKRKGEFYRK